MHECSILAANNYALAMQISPQTLNRIEQYLNTTPAGQNLCSVIKRRHENNNVMITLFSVNMYPRLAKESALKGGFPDELFDQVLEGLDGRRRPGF